MQRLSTYEKPTVILQRSANRFHADHGWLHAAHSFSFGRFQDPENVSWGGLHVFNDDVFEPKSGFPTHPHHDVEILTYVINGALEHKDSTGSHGIVRNGGVQYMSAGTGIRHSEYNHSADEQLHLIQMWIEPGVLGQMPTYGQVDFAPEDRQDKWLVVASGESGLEAPIPLTANATFRVAQLRGDSRTHRFAAARRGFLFVGTGEVVATITLDDSTSEPVKLGTGDAVRMASIDAVTTSGDAEIVLWDMAGTISR